MHTKDSRCHLSLSLADSMFNAELNIWTEHLEQRESESEGVQIIIDTYRCFKNIMFDFINR